jgi:hypothetical protein
MILDLKTINKIVLANGYTLNTIKQMKGTTNRNQTYLINNKIIIKLFEKPNINSE